MGYHDRVKRTYERAKGDERYGEAVAFKAACLTNMGLAAEADAEIARLRRVVDAAQFQCDICGELAVDAVDGWGRCQDHLPCRECGCDERDQGDYLTCQCLINKEAGDG